MKMMIAIALLAIGSFGFSGEKNNVSAGLTLEGPGLAAHGYDVVAFFKQKAAVRGTAQFSTVHDQATYRFSNKENLELFKKNPVSFLPQYGGYCAFGAALGAKFDGDPEHWRVVDGKLYLNLSGDIQTKWLEDLKGNIAKADQNWPKIADKAPASLK